jgi:tetratricopeptide (TPR) repeat protein
LTADAVSAAGPAGRRKARKVAGAARHGSGAREAVPVSRLLAEKAPLLLLAVAAGALTLRAQRGIVQSTEVFPIAARIANAFVSYARYLAKLLWPVDLAVFYPYRARSFAEAETWAAVLIVVGLTSAAVMLRRRGYTIVGWLWFLGTLVPVLGLVQAGIQSMADRYTYVPVIGILIVVVWGAADLLRSLRVPAPAAAAGSMAVLVVLSTLTWRQVEVWRDDESLFGHAARVTTGSYWAHYNLGLTLLNTGRGAEAVPEFEEAARVEPSSNQALENLGFALEAAGRIDDAAAAFERAARADESDLSAAQNWARVLVTHDRAAEALPVAEAALRRWPADAQLNYSVGLSHLFLDRPELAIHPLTRAIAANPGYAAAQNALGIAFARQGDRAAAIEHFKRALELEPTYQEARANLAMVEE